MERRGQVAFPIEYGRGLTVRAPPGSRVTMQSDDRVSTQLLPRTEGYRTSARQELHFGLGEALEADVEVKWPAGGTTHLRAEAGVVTIQETP